uniref:Nodule-specific cysteine-rich peptide L62 n=1 Tax=Lens culinaris TaxID=3864 RepID=A0A7T8IG28_LENCU|nr:nodule-specific cysteine-rich peptide L62 [Lens culinaris]
MSSVIKFVYVLIIYISLFIVLTDFARVSSDRSFPTTFTCNVFKDCPWDLCINEIGVFCHDGICGCL